MMAFVGWNSGQFRLEIDQIFAVIDMMAVVILVLYLKFRYIKDYLNISVFFTPSSNHNILLLVQSFFINGEKECILNGDS
jgi:hypothetical protein